MDKRWNGCVLVCGSGVALLGSGLPADGCAQGVDAAGSRRVATEVASLLPDAPGYGPGFAAGLLSGSVLRQTAQPGEQAQALSGTVLDVNGGVVPEATVTLQGGDTSRVATSDGNGFFRFAAVPAGSYQVTIAATGFESWSQAGVVIEAGRDSYLPSVALQLAGATTNVRVTLTEHELATEQVRVQEKQRMFGILPNFYTSYVWKAAPLSPGQKFGLAYHSITDPLTFVGAAGVAALEQGRESYPSFGQEAGGYGKRLGAAFADRALTTTLGDALLPTLFRQDPRYYYKGTGSKSSRALYAITRTVIARGDKGEWQPNYSNVLGAFGAASAGTLYYPAADRTAGSIVSKALLSISFSAIDGLIREFLPPAAAGAKP